MTLDLQRLGKSVFTENVIIGFIGYKITKQKMSI